jgi:ABC-type oligopeptide transport system substrate-binding subunit
MRGDPQYSGDFTHFGYVNPGAPKGGSITRYAIGTYDNFHRKRLCLFSLGCSVPK